jgi:hypothetical protein
MVSSLTIDDGLPCNGKSDSRSLYGGPRIRAWDESRVAAASRRCIAWTNANVCTAEPFADPTHSREIAGKDYSVGAERTILSQPMAGGATV